MTLRAVVRSLMTAINRKRLPHRGQSMASAEYIRFGSVAQATRGEVAKSFPRSSRFQWATVVALG